MFGKVSFEMKSKSNQVRKDQTGIRSGPRPVINPLTILTTAQWLADFANGRVSQTAIVIYRHWTFADL